MIIRMTLSVTLFGFSAASHADPLLCDQLGTARKTCSCDLRTLRPLQGAIGMGEVRIKAAKIEKDPEKQKEKLKSDPIKVVRGPGRELFVTDHHHGARAWLEAGYVKGFCVIQDEKLPSEPTQFWAQLNKRNLVRLADRNGEPISPDSLPKAIVLLPDDPYRTLAYLVRKKDGFCRGLMAQREFAEFVWADWLRQRVELPPSKVETAPEEVLPAALELVESPAAAGQPGYRGDKPSGYACPIESDAP